MVGDQDRDAPLRCLLEGLLGDAGVDVLDEVTTEDVTFEAVTGDAYDGRAVIKDVLRESMAAYDSFDLEIEWTVAEGDRIVASTRTTAETNRGILGIPPPEDTRTIDTIFDARLEDGRIAYLRQVFDTRQMMPVALRRGRGAVLEQMRDGVVVLDDRELVVDANAAALELVGAERANVLGEPIADVLGVDSFEAGATTEPTELERDGRIYEVRTSPVFAEEDGPVGHALVARDVTERERHTRQLAEQRDELERLSDLNSILRGVNQSLVAARDCAGIDRAVCDRLADTELYDAACVGDVQSWTGDAHRWTVAGDCDPDVLSLPGLSGQPAARSDGGSAIRRTLEPSIDAADSTTGSEATGDEVTGDGATAAEGSDTWVAVPLRYGTTLYGALGLCTERDRIADREREVLLELGETVGHAINVVETRRLLSSDATVALEFTSTDDADPLVTATRDADASVELDGLVPVGKGRSVAYFRIGGEAPATVVESLASADAGDVRTVREDDEWIVEWRLNGDAPLRVLAESGGNVLAASAGEAAVCYEIEVASDADVRSLVDRLRRRFPDVRLRSKAERPEPAHVREGGGPATDAGLTQCQHEALEAAYRSGYFSWPRDTTAEEVAESLDIAPSTLHSHLRKAEASVLESFFADDA